MLPGSCREVAGESGKEIRRYHFPIIVAGIVVGKEKLPDFVVRLMNLEPGK
jgi:hypothetical protein